MDLQALIEELEEIEEIIATEESEEESVEELEELLEKLEAEFTFMLQEKTDATHSAVRFCTSWATTEESVDALCRKLESLS